MTMTNVQLFHLIADGACGRVRARVVALGLEAPVSFRNVHFDQAKADFERLGGTTVPALWDGETLHSGEEATLAALERLARV